jgi:hypothetical protein
MESLKHIPAEHPFTQRLEKRYLSLLNGCASNVRFEPGERIFREGEEANKLSGAPQFVAEFPENTLFGELAYGQSRGFAEQIPQGAQPVMLVPTRQGRRRASRAARLLGGHPLASLSSTEILCSVSLTA